MNFINKIEDSILKARTLPKKIDLRGNYYRDQTAILHLIYPGRHGWCVSGGRDIRTDSQAEAWNSR